MSSFELKSPMNVRLTRTFLATVLCAFFGACSMPGQPSLAPAASVTNAGIRGAAMTASKETVLYRFTGGSSGYGPVGELIAVGATIYGTTADGGVGCPTNSGCGTIYSVSPSGVVKTLYAFKGGRDGAYPFAGLVSVNGKLYGTTLEGGVATCEPSYETGFTYACGTVYEFDPSTREEKVLYRFQGGTDGVGPRTALVAIGTTLYGTTRYGGTCTKFAGGCGTIFKLDASGHSYKQLYDFAGGTDGASPTSGLTNVGGTLYGVTYSGGPKCECGTVFRIDPSTGAFKVTYAFLGHKDGWEPVGTMAYSGSLLYGTTLSGGGGSCFGGTTGYSCGTLFSVDPASGKEKIIHAFAGGADGSLPTGPLIFANGTVYGMTESGGTGTCSYGSVGPGCGVAFSFGLKSGVTRAIYSFTGGSNGGSPFGGLLMLGNRLYGSTEAGGNLSCKGGCGVLFSLTP